MAFNLWPRGRKKVLRTALMPAPPPVTDPRNLPLIAHGANPFTYLGSFNGVPSNFNNSGTGLSISGQQMYMSAHVSSSCQVGQFTIPTPAQIQANFAASNPGLNPASASPGFAPVTITGTFGQAPGSDFLLATATLPFGGSLYVNCGLSYDSRGNSQVANIVKCASDMSTIGSPVAFSPDVATSHLANFCNHLGVVPAIWQSLLGGPCFVTGGPGLSIINNMSIGPGFSTFDPANISAGGGTCPITVWMNYPYGLNQQQVNDGTTGRTGLWSRPNVIGSITSSKLTVNSTVVAGSVVNIGATLLYRGSPNGDAANAVTITSQNGDGTYNLSNSPADVAFTGSPNIWVSNTVTNPLSGVSTDGQDLVSTYQDIQGIYLIPTGTRSLLSVYVHGSGPHANPIAGQCEPGASGNAMPPVVRIMHYDLAKIISTKASAARGGIQPEGWWDFPGWNVSPLNWTPCPGVPVNGCRNSWLCYDPVQQVMYGTPMGTSGSPTTTLFHAWSVAAN